MILVPDRGHATYRMLFGNDGDILTIVLVTENKLGKRLKTTRQNLQRITVFWQAVFEFEQLRFSR